MRLACKGEVLGFEDIVNGRNYASNVRCVSQKGTLFKIDKKIFLNAANSDKKIAELMLKLMNEKDKNTATKIFQAKIVN